MGRAFAAMSAGTIAEARRGGSGAPRPRFANRYVERYGAGAVRSLVFRFHDLSALEHALAGERPELPLPPDERVAEGELVVSTFEVGPRRHPTAAPARATERDGRWFVVFDARDWERLASFVTARSSRMRAAPAVELHEVDASASDTESPSSRRNLTPFPSSVRLASLRARVTFTTVGERPDDMTRLSLEALGFDVRHTPRHDDVREALDAGEVDLLVVAVPASASAASAALLAEVRALAAPPPVLVVAAEDASAELVVAFAHGADDFVRHPVRAAELTARVVALLRRSRLLRGASTAP